MGFESSHLHSKAEAAPADVLKDVAAGLKDKMAERGLSEQKVPGELEAEDAELAPSAPLPDGEAQALRDTLKSIGL